MTSPIDIIATAIHDAECGCDQPEAVAFSTAAIAVGALTDDRVVDHATTAMRAALDGEGFTVTQSGEPAGPGDLRGLAAAVLRSVGGA